MPIIKLLYPLALIYGLITWVRNKFFDWGIFKQIRFDIPIVGIGNLSMGGTGKTPHIEYFITKCQNDFEIALISRGYGRKTKGFYYVDSDDFSENVGDEPLQIKKKFNQILVAVCENRVLAIRKLMAENPKINLILLDDAFQHRYVKPSLNILLTEYKKPFWKDAVIPAGTLREFSSGYKRADIIIVTKCPEQLALKLPNGIQQKPIYYSRINYQNPNIVSGKSLKKIILVTGIANINPLIEYLENEKYEIIHHFNFTDHYNFNTTDIKRITDKYYTIEEVLILTTEKDWMRLEPYFKDKDLNLGYLPITVSIENEPHWQNKILPPKD